MKKRTLITKLTLLCVGLLFFASCSDLLGFQEGTSSARTGGNGKVIFTGTISVSGALPAALSHATESSHADGDSVASRSALPSITIGDDYYYYVTATKTDGSEPFNINSLSTPNPFTTTNGVTFALELATGKWNIECGIKKAKISGTTSENDLPVMSDTYLAPLTSANPVVNHTFYPKPSQNGNGLVGLSMTIPTTVTTVTATCSNSAWGDNISVYVGGTIVTVMTKNMTSGGSTPSGSYEVAFNFYDENNILLYSTVQTINVFENMTTNTWVSDGSGIINESGDFNLTSALITQFARTTFYVGSTSVGAASNDTGNGSPYAPLETVNKAVEVIAATGNGSKDYRIYVSGTVTGAQEISGAVNGKAQSITIQGYNGLDTNGEPKDELNGNNEGSSLTIDTNVSVTIKNLKITGGSGTPVSGRQRGGGIYVKSGSVTLSEGTLITGNNADHGGGIYVESAATALIAGGEISANTANIYGGGIYNRGNVFVYGNSNFKNNSCTVSMQYGGAVYNSGNLYLGYSSASNKSEWKGEISGNSAVSAGAIWSAAGAKVCFDSGTIKGNSANWNGQNQSLLIMGTGVFEMGGSAYIASTDPVYLCAFGSDDIISPVTITSPLTAHSASAQITLTPSEWKRGTTVVQADGTNLTTLKKDGEYDYTNYFVLTDSDWNTKPSTDNKSLMLDAPIYVAGTGRDDTGDGTKAKPYATIAKAIELLTDKDTDYTIYIDGTVTGAQTIPSTLKKDGTGTYKAQSVVICGATGNTTDILNGGFTQTSNGTTLKILTDVPVTIKNLKITGGYAAQSSAGGGGIYAKGDVTLSEGALVSGNYTASCGGGIYNYSKNLTIESGAEISGNGETGPVNDAGGGAIFNYGGTVMISGGVIKSNYANHNGGAIYNEDGTCYIYGDTLIGKEVSVAPDNWSNGSNRAENGGAIYNKSGNIYIGYKNNNGTPAKDDEASVKIMGNAVKTSSSKGGAIYVAAETLQIAKTCIGFNYSPYSGAGIYTKGRVSLLEDAVVKGNKAFQNNASSYGGGVYIDQGGQLSMGGNSIIGGSESGDANTAAKGGGVYVSSSAQTTPAGVTFGAANSTQSIMGNSSTEAGGGVYINGLYATFTMHSGSISNNKLVGGETGGGGIHVAEGTLNFEGGEISGNVIETPSSTNIKGGAIDIGTSGKFNIKGAVSIPYGGETGKNDVRINTSTAITITGAITGTDTDIRLIPYSYSEGEAVLALADGVTNTTIAIARTKFSLSNSDYSISTAGKIVVPFSPDGVISAIKGITKSDTEQTFTYTVKGTAGSDFLTKLYAALGDPEQTNANTNLKNQYNQFVKWIELDLSELVLTELPANALKNLGVLKSLILPKTLTSLGNDAIYGCDHIENLTFYGNIQTYGSSPFPTYALKTITMLDGNAGKICSYAFNNVNKLETVYLPASLKSIENYGFAYCEPDNEIKMIFAGTKEQWSNVEKGSRWNYNSNFSTIICSDGNTTP